MSKCKVYHSDNFRKKDVEQGAPLLSLIVIAYNVENYIEQALLSCLKQGVDGYEIIVVCNKSSDDTLEIIKRVARGFQSIVTLIINDENVGPGEARNQGMRIAAGDYILFLDGDDWLAPDALCRVKELVLKHSPDVLLFDYERFNLDGSKIPNRLAQSLWRGWRNGPQVRSPLLLNLSVAWNKAYAREFLQSHYLEFPHGLYEDIEWAVKTTILAKTLYVVPDVLIYYRQRAGSILRSASEGHFDAISRHKQVLSFLQTKPEFMSAYAPYAFSYARSQLLNVAAVKNRLPPERVGDYLRQSTELLEKFRRAAGVNKVGLLERVARLRCPSLFFLVHRLGRWVKPKVMALPRLLRLGEIKLKHIIYKYIFLRFPVQVDKVVYDAFWGKKIDCNPLAIYEALSRQGKYRQVWLLKHVPKPQMPDVTRSDSLMAYWHLATAKYFVSNVNFENVLVKRKGTIHLQTHHGTPLKYMGLDLRDNQPEHMDWRAFAQRSSRWDYVISSNHYSSAIWRRSYPYSYKVLEVGYPRNDIFFQASNAGVKEIRRKLGIPDGKKVALYAPTFRDEQKNKSAGSAFASVDLSRIAVALGDEYVLLVRAHYFLEEQGCYGENIINVSEHSVTNEICLISDILITDYSSIMFDYAILERPIIIYAYEWEEYKKSRGVYFDLKANPPGVFTQNMDELCELLSAKRYHEELFHQRLLAFREKFCEFDDGQATSRLIERVFS